MQDLAQFFQLLSERISANGGKIPAELLRALGEGADQALIKPQIKVPVHNRGKKEKNVVKVKNPEHRKIIMKKLFGIEA